MGAFYPYDRGSLFTALIVLYALTAGISGYVACSYYRQMEGGSWVRNVLATSFVYCGPLFLVFCFNNTVAIVYRVQPPHPPPPSSSPVLMSCTRCNLIKAWAQQDRSWNAGVASLPCHPVMQRVPTCSFPDVRTQPEHAPPWSGDQPEVAAEVDKGAFL